MTEDLTNDKIENCPTSNLNSIEKIPTQKSGHKTDKIQIKKRFKPNANNKVAFNKLVSLPKFSRSKYEKNLKPLFNVNLLNPTEDDL